jgi:phage gpG-like protein
MLDTIGINETLQHFQQAAKESPQFVDMAARQTAFAIQANAVKRMKNTKRGSRVYKRGKSGKTHRSSAPGEAPAPDTGRLMNSVRTKSFRKGYIVGTHLAYGRYLEYGTKRIDQRPWLRPSAQEEGPRFKKRLRKLLRRYLNA